MPRGRPKGTLKREHAVAAANAVRTGEFADVREAALEHFPAHIGPNAKPLTMAEASELERFRDFVGYVEEAYRALIRTDPRGLRRDFLPLAQRGAHRRVQPKSPTNPLRRLRAALGLEPDSAN
jgi:hypothetical protein